MIGVWPGDKAETMKEFRNSWGSAPIIWDVFCQRHLGTHPYSFMQHIDEMWPVYKKPEVPEFAKAVILMTYDNALIYRKDFARAAEDLRWFLDVYRIPEDRVNHWYAIIEILEHNPDVPAIGFWMTSVVENPFQGPFDEELDDYRSPDWSRYWDVYAEVQEVMNGQVQD